MLPQAGLSLTSDAQVSPVFNTSLSDTGEALTTPAEEPAEPAAYPCFREWMDAVARGDWGMVWDLTDPQGPLRAEFGDRDAFPEVARRRMRPLPGIHAADWVRLRMLNPGEALLTAAVDLHSRERRDITLQRWHMIWREEGWRVWAIDSRRVDRQVARDRTHWNLFDSVQTPADHAPRVLQLETLAREERKTFLAARTARQGVAETTSPA